LWPKIDRIPKGAKTAAVPVERPSKFRRVIDQSRTARDACFAAAGKDEVMW